MTLLNQVDIEKGTVEVAEFTQTDAALAELRKKYSVIPDANTTEGYEFVKAGCKELTGLRTAIENKRKEIKGPYIAAGQIIDAEAKRITASIVELEDPLKSAKKLVDDKEKRMKEERIAKLQQKIDNILAVVGKARNAESAYIADLIADVDAIDATQDFYELTNEAVKARASVLQELGELYNQRLNWEESEKLRLEQAEQLRQQENIAGIERRINSLKMQPLEYMQRSRLDIENQITRLQNYVLSPDDFGDRYEEAEAARAEVVKQLQYMAEQKPVEEPKPEPESGNLQMDAAKIEAPKIAALEESSASAAIEAATKKQPEAMITLLVTCKATDRNKIEMMLGTVAGVSVQLID